MAAVGYSGKPLAAKLGIRDGSRVKPIGAPREYLDWLAPLPPTAKVSSRLKGSVDIVHLFTASRSALGRALEPAIDAVRPDGMIWVSWPKKSSGVSSEVSEDTIRELALPLGLVDVKVCAVSEVWSGLKLVLRKTLR